MDYGFNNINYNFDVIVRYIYYHDVSFKIQDVTCKYIHLNICRQKPNKSTSIMHTYVNK